MAAARDFRLLSDRPLLLRVLTLYGGLLLYGFSAGLVIESGLGNFPWDVLHEGLARQLTVAGLQVSIGLVAIAVSFLLLLFWIPLRQRPGLGTISNALLVGVFIDLTMAVVPDLEAMWLRVAALTSGIVLNGLATVLYIVPDLGPGPRDGLMTGVVRVTRAPVWATRLGIEIVVLATGYLLGGTLGLGTVAYAVGIGYVTQFFLNLAQRRWGTTGPRARDGD